MALLEVSGTDKVLPKQKLEAWLVFSPHPVRGSPVIQDPGLSSVCPMTGGTFGSLV